MIHSVHRVACVAAWAVAPFTLPAVAWAQEAGHAAGGGGGGGGLFSVSLGLAVWTWVLFLLLLLVLSKTAWRPLLRVLEERERRIQEAIDSARLQREEAERILEEHRRMLARAQGEAQDIVAQGRKAAERLKEELLDEGRREQDQILARARDEIGRERERALEALRRDAVDLSLAAAERLLRRRVDSAENRRLVEEFLSELPAGGPGGERSS